MVEQEDSFVFEIVRTIINGINKDEHITVLNNVSLLFNIIDPDLKDKEIKSLEKEVDEILNNHNTMRVLRVINKVKEENSTSIEYYYKDRGRDARLFYNYELENKMMTLNKRIRIALSKIINNTGVLKL